MVLQPLFTARWYVVRRAQAIRAVEKLHGTRVITMIHRQEKRSLFGFAVSRHIDLEDPQTIIAAIKDTPEDMPIDFVIHTPGGLVLAELCLHSLVFSCCSSRRSQSFCRDASHDPHAASSH
jgi:ClpP class serine protease